MAMRIQGGSGGNLASSIIPLILQDKLAKRRSTTAFERQREINREEDVRQRSRTKERQEEETRQAGRRTIDANQTAHIENTIYNASIADTELGKELGNPNIRTAEQVFDNLGPNNHEKLWQILNLDSGTSRELTIDALTRKMNRPNIGRGIDLRSKRLINKEKMRGIKAFDKRLKVAAEMYDVIEGGIEAGSPEYLRIRLKKLNKAGISGKAEIEALQRWATLNEQINTNKISRQNYHQRERMNESRYQQGVLKDRNTDLTKLIANGIKPRGRAQLNPRLFANEMLQVIKGVGMSKAALSQNPNDDWLWAVADGSIPGVRDLYVDEHGNAKTYDWRSEGGDDFQGMMSFMQWAQFTLNRRKSQPSPEMGAGAADAALPFMPAPAPPPAPAESFPPEALGMMAGPTPEEQGHGPVGSARPPLPSGTLPELLGRAGSSVMDVLSPSDRPVPETSIFGAGQKGSLAAHTERMQQASFQKVKPYIKAAESEGLEIFVNSGLTLAEVIRALKHIEENPDEDSETNTHTLNQAKIVMSNQGHGF